MNSTTGKLVTWNIKKDKKLEAKKRKLEALLKLVSTDEIAVPVKKKKEEDSLVESYKSLKDELKRYMKKQNFDASFYLTEIGLKAQVNFKYYNKDKCPGQTISPLFIEDIYHLLLKSLIGHLSPYQLRWCKLEHPQNISKTIVLVVEGLSKWDIVQNISSLSYITDIFTSMVDVVSSNIPFATELSTLHLVSDFHVQVKDTYSSLFPINKTSEKTTVHKTPSKLHLLLSPIQLVMENYPLPQSVFTSSKSENYNFTKDSYLPVSANSPMFALDCEMCSTTNSSNEVTRIAIVNECLEVVYHTFVKPREKIIDYRTKYSGVTKELLENVTIRLSDVQEKIKSILPADAILCGQSLNCDLHALKMIHPYVIDTSVIFNASGIRNKKDSLRNLALMHLKEKIQVGKKGHNPVEDCITTMKLVQLKLGNTVQYGDAVLGSNSTNAKKDMVPEEVKICQETNKINCSSDSSVEKISDVKEEVNNSKNIDGFFGKASKFSKKICIVGNKDSLDHYCSDLLTDAVHKITKSNIKKIVKATISNLETFDLTLCHILKSCEMHDFITELNNVVKQLYDGCPDKSLFLMLASGVDKEKFEDIKNGLFMTVLKK